MKNTFIAISDQILAEVPQIKIVDLNLGQINLGNLPVEYPAALISIAYPHTENIAGSQIYTLSVGVKLIFDPSNLATSSITPSQWRNESLEILNVVDMVVAALNDFDSDHFNALELQSSTPEPGAEFIYNLTFESNFEVDY